jgi:hypothetical protein
VVDQNGIGNSPPVMTMGQRALNQWYSRVIALPSAWNGKTIISAAMSMAGVAASVTQTMLVKNFMITSAADVETMVGGMGSFVDLGVWEYGLESNVAVTVRRESLGTSVPTEALVDGAVSRGSLVTATGMNSVSLSEVVLATFTNVAFMASTFDSIRVWVQWNPKPTAGDAGQDDTVTVRLRRGNISGPIIIEQVMRIVAGTKGGAAGSGVAGFFQDFTIEFPNVTGFQSYVFTMINVKNGTTGPWGVTVNHMKLMTLVRSA